MKRLGFLFANALAHKFGFQDGDLLDDFDVPSEIDKHEVLIRLVRSKLLPLIPEVEVFEICTVHNPIRAEDEWVAFCLASPLSVVFDQSDVDAAVTHILAHSAPQMGDIDDQHRPATTDKEPIMELTQKTREKAAAALAEAVNGGKWMVDYTETQREVWRHRVDLAMSLRPKDVNRQ